MEQRFEQYDDDYLKFDRVEHKLATRADVHAFILLDRLFPANGDIVAAAEHDELYLGIDPEQIESLTDAQILELVRCGVRYSQESLAMFV